MQHYVWLTKETLFVLLKCSVCQRLDYVLKAWVTFKMIHS